MTRSPKSWALSARATLIVAIAMTVLAEVIYLFVWGVILFPGGDIIGKVVWTATCGVAMGAVVGAVVIVAAPKQRRGAFALAAVSMAAVGSGCAVLCSRIDARFDYFGGPDESSLFILAGVLPAVAGGLLYGWLIASPAVFQATQMPPTSTSGEFE